MNGHLLNGGSEPQTPLATEDTKPRALRKRPPKTTPDGRMNEVAAAVYLGRSVSTLQNWRSMGLLPRYLKEHGRIFYRQTDLDDFRGV